MSEHNDQTSHSTLSGMRAIYDEVRTYRVKYVEELEATAKKWRADYFWLNKVSKKVSDDDDFRIKGLEATATQRLELLRRWNEKRVNECEQCVFCGKFPTPIYDEIRIIDGQEWKPVIRYEDKHADDCKLAKELET